MGSHRQQDEDWMSGKQKLYSFCAGIFMVGLVATIVILMLAGATWILRMAGG